MPQLHRRWRASSSLSAVLPESPLDETTPAGRPIKRRSRSASGVGGVSRRRRGGASIKIIKWRDIPAQVNAVNGDDKVQIELPHRFQAAIDRAAMLADRKDANSYIAEMGQSLASTPGTDLQHEAEQLVAEIETEFTTDRLNDYVRNGGFDPDTPDEVDGDLQ